MTILDKLNQRMTDAGSLVCVGLDTRLDQLPDRFKTSATPLFDFNRWIIDQTHAHIAAFKPNMAFYEAHGTHGLQQLSDTISYLRNNHPTIFTICDAKRGDIGSTNDAYVAAIFDKLGFDAVTLHPYLGREALSPFLARRDRGCIILCRTSNPGAGELQDLRTDEGRSLWQVVADKVAHDWNSNQNCMLVVGATYPDEMRIVRQITGDMPFLVPGIGAQGGDVEAVVKNGLDNTGRGLLISASRSIIYSANPANAAQQLKDEINRYRG